MIKPIPHVVVDLCSRKGGATKGYQRAGLWVIGADIDPQPGYPGDEFLKADARDVLTGMIFNGGMIQTEAFGWVHPDFIHLSPPCQEANSATLTNRTRGIKDDHVQLIPELRDLATLTGVPFLIEQPSSSRKGTISRDLMLCMDMFRPADKEPPWVIKHRTFELHGLTVPQPAHHRHAGRVRGWRHGEYFDGPYVAGYGLGGGKATAAELQHAMDIDWMTDRFDLCEAIPPAYTEYIGNTVRFQ